MITIDKKGMSLLAFPLELRIKGIRGPPSIMEQGEFLHPHWFFLKGASWASVWGSVGGHYLLAALGCCISLAEQEGEVLRQVL